MSVAPPAPAPRAAAACQDLHDQLPDPLDGRDRRDTEPESDLTAAWGDPAVVLRCGVPVPSGLRPTSELIEVDGVGWYFEESARGYLFTTVDRVADVSVRVPPEVPRERVTGVLVDLAGPIDQSLPTQLSD